MRIYFAVRFIPRQLTIDVLILYLHSDLTELVIVLTSYCESEKHRKDYGQDSVRFCLNFSTYETRQLTTSI